MFWLDSDITYLRSPLTRSTEVKCLGVLLYDTLTWGAQVNSLKRKAYRGLIKLKRLRNVLPPAIKKKLYNAMVLLHLEYCSVVWQECAVELRSMLKRVQNYGMRFILSKPPPGLPVTKCVPFLDGKLWRPDANNVELLISTDA